jgi:uncharacterized protein (TIGR03086 family)
LSRWSSSGDGSSAANVRVMDNLEAIRQSSQEFETRLRQVVDGQWDLPTPCTEWNVRELTNHILLGTRMSVQLLAGVSRDDVISELGDDLMAGSQDPVADFVALAAEMQDAFAVPGGLEGIVDHPMGEIPRTMFVGFRIMDNGTHAWDLARAIGADEQLDPNLVSHLWDDIQPMAAGLGELGVFGESASGDVGEDAPLQTRFLDLVGRRP